jgi:hypothetical protein
MQDRAVSHRKPLTALLALLATGCSEWHLSRGPSPRAADEGIKAAKGNAIRVELNSGALVTFTSPRVSNDSIFGVDYRFGRSEVAVAVADVRRVEFERVSIGTVLAFLVASGLAVTSIVVATCATLVLGSALGGG